VSRSTTPCPWRTAPPMPPCYRATVAADLDALLADPSLDAGLAARIAAAAFVGLSGAEFADEIARLRDLLRGECVGRGGAVAAADAGSGTLFDGM
jgi:hypothetical protein